MEKRKSVLYSKLPTETKEMLKVASVQSTKVRQIIRKLSKLKEENDIKNIEERVICYVIKIGKGKEKTKHLNFMNRGDLQTLSEIEQKYSNNHVHLLRLSRQVARLKKDVHDLIRRLKYYMRKHPRTPEKWSSIAKEETYWNETFFPITEFYEEILLLENTCDDANDSLKQIGFMFSAITKLIETLHKSIAI